MDIQSAYINLKLLSAVEPYNKIQTKQKFFHIVGPTGTVPVSIQRWWAGENREGLLQDLKQLIEYVGSEIASPESQYEQTYRLKEHLLQSLKGLASLRKTYEEDKTTVAKLELLEDQANAILQGAASPRLSIPVRAANDLPPSEADFERIMSEQRKG